MSRPKYWWRPNVERVIRNYPLLREKKNARQLQSMIASYSGMPRGGGAGRNTESVAMRQLSPREEEDLRAVEKAIEDVAGQELGQEVLRVAELYYWRGVGNIYTVADIMFMSERTVQRRCDRFVYSVARNLGYK